MLACWLPPALLTGFGCSVLGSTRRLCEATLAFRNSAAAGVSREMPPEPVLSPETEMPEAEVPQPLSIIKVISGPPLMNPNFKNKKKKSHVLKVCGNFGGHSLTLKYAPFCFCCEKYDFFPPRKYKPENICQSGFVRCPIHITESAPDGKQWFSLQVTLRLEPSSLGPSQREPDEVPWSTMCLFNLLVSFIPLDRLWVTK